MSCYCPAPARVTGSGRLKTPRHSRWALFAPLQGSNIFLLAPPGRVARRSQTKLIKEDHFACTTKMSEFFGFVLHICVSNALDEPGSLPNRSSTPGAFGNTSSRLSDYSLVKERLSLTPPSFTSSSSQDFPDRFPDRGRGIIAVDPTLSIGWRENSPPPC